MENTIVKNAVWADPETKKINLMIKKPKAVKYVKKKYVLSPSIFLF